MHELRVSVEVGFLSNRNFAMALPESLALPPHATLSEASLGARRGLRGIFSAVRLGPHAEAGSGEGEADTDDAFDTQQDEQGSFFLRLVPGVTLLVVILISIHIVNTWLRQPRAIVDADDDNLQLPVRDDDSDEDEL